MTLMIQRELPLARVRCLVCQTPYLVSMLHPIPECADCGLTPDFECETLWYLDLDDA